MKKQKLSCAAQSAAVVLFLFICACSDSTSRPEQGQSRNTVSATDLTGLPADTPINRYPSSFAFLDDLRGFMGANGAAAVDNKGMRRFSRFVAKSIGVSPSSLEAGQKMQGLLLQGRPGFGELFSEASRLTGECFKDVPQGGALNESACESSENFLKSQNYLATIASPDQSKKDSGGFMRLECSENGETIVTIQSRELTFKMLKMTQGGPSVCNKRVATKTEVEEDYYKFAGAIQSQDVSSEEKNLRIANIQKEYHYPEFQ